MNARSRTARRVIRARAAASRLVSSLRKGRSLATHALEAAGGDTETAKTVAGGLRAAAKRLGLVPARTARTRRTLDGRTNGRLRKVGHWTGAQIAVLAAAYRPRSAAALAAVAVLRTGA